jgi:hypothetical protein
MSDIDTNKLAVGIITDLTKDLIKNLYESIPNKLSDKYKQYFEQFNFSLNRDYKTCSFVRTIINKEASVSLDQIYVKTRYISDDSIYDDDDLCQKIRDGQRGVVLGFGGIGKTIFCKYLWCGIFQNPEGKIPVFFELRNLNDLTTQDLISYLRLSLTETGKVLSPDVFNEMMKDGRFIFILDGFDEIPDQNRKEIERQVLSLASDYPSCGLVVSSRFDDRFYSWGEFNIFRAQNFEKDQSREVIEKAKFNDEEIKKEFITEIIEKRYDQYEEFFATPLLTLMMLMTYSQIKYIPDNSTIFYKYAFQTLYTLHDASKQAFQRKRYIDLSESDFIHVFSLFCLVSYIDKEHSFEKVDLIRRLDAVKTRVKFDYDSNEFLNECVESVNLLYKDGTTYNFTHRSFQEYFCAYAATHYYPENFKELILMIPVSNSDSVFSMIGGINTDIFEKMYVLPEFKKYQNQLADFTKLRTPWNILVKAKSVFSVVFNPSRRHWAFHHARFEHNYEFKEFNSRILNAYETNLHKEIGDDEILPIELLYKQVNNFVEGICKHASYKCGKEKIYQLVVNFSDMEIHIRCVGNKSTFHDSTDIEFEIYDINLIKDLVNNNAYTKRITEKMKSNAVFIEKMCLDLKRHESNVKNSGDDVLSM